MQTRPIDPSMQEQLPVTAPDAASLELQREAVADLGADRAGADVRGGGFIMKDTVILPRR